MPNMYVSIEVIITDNMEQANQKYIFLSTITLFGYYINVLNC